MINLLEKSSSDTSSESSESSDNTSSDTSANALLAESAVVVETQQLQRTYRQAEQEVHALAGIDLTITQGEFTAFMGPSGSGKTTLLNCIGALDQPTAGTVRVNGRELSALTKRQRAELRRNEIGFIFQSYNLLPVLTAYENAEFILLARGVPAAQRRERVMALLDAVGLQGLENRRPTELSGGQQQRVAIARAMAGEPALILADEPTANLDTKTGAALIQLMYDLNQSHQTTFLFSTHDPQVMQAARRVVTLVDGRIDHDLYKS